MNNKLKELIPYIIIIIVVLLIRTFFVTPARVDGDSMLNTLYNGEIVILNKISLKTDEINRFDIIVIDYENDLLIKRVIGLPNETIEYKNNELYINGELTKTPIKFEDTEDFKETTKDNEYFVLGDNRDDSKDSRYFGNVNLSKIKGKVNFVLFPFKHFGKIE